MPWYTITLKVERLERTRLRMPDEGVTELGAQAAERMITSGVMAGENT